MTGSSTQSENVVVVVNVLKGLKSFFLSDNCVRSMIFKLQS